MVDSEAQETAVPVLRWVQAKMPPAARVATPSVENQSPLGASPPPIVANLANRLHPSIGPKKSAVAAGMLLDRLVGSDI
jgi:hypothetical protein